MVSTVRVQDMYDRFTSQITASVKKYISLKPQRLGNHKPLWMMNILKKNHPKKKTVRNIYCHNIHRAITGISTSSENAERKFEDRNASMK